MLHSTRARIDLSSMPGLRAVGPGQGGACGATQDAHSVRGDKMGKEARAALILAGTASLLAVMVDWVVEELT
jgi:hypothetical protein